MSLKWKGFQACVIFFIFRYNNVHVSPSAVEAGLRIHPGVSDCLVFGKPNPPTVELVSALVQKKSGFHNVSPLTLTVHTEKESQTYSNFRWRRMNWSNLYPIKLAPTTNAFEGIWFSWTKCRATQWESCSGDGQKIMPNRAAKYMQISSTSYFAKLKCICILYFGSYTWLKSLAK